MSVLQIYSVIVVRDGFLFLVVIENKKILLKEVLRIIFSFYEPVICKSQIRIN